MIQVSSVIGAARKAKAGFAESALAAAKRRVRDMASSRSPAALGVAALALGFASTASAVPIAPLYDNGPLNGTITAWNFTAGAFQVSDSFTLSQAATITGITFAVWLSPGDTLASVDWGISASPFADNGTATPTGSFVLNNGSRDIDSETISIAPLSLAAGTYWLNLSKGHSARGDFVNWDQNDGPSSSTIADYSGHVLSGMPWGSESFQILGTVDAAPEPATWAMMMLGLFGAGAALRAQRRQRTGPALA